MSQQEANCRMSIGTQENLEAEDRTPFSQSDEASTTTESEDP